LNARQTFELREGENKKQKITPTFPISKELCLINMKTNLNSQEGFSASGFDV
jgi:hypothetical protein